MPPVDLGAEQNKTDLEMAGRFIATLAGDAKEPVCFQTFSDKKSDEKDKLARCFHASFGNALERLAKLNAQGAGVFVTVNSLDKNASRHAKNIRQLRALFVDQDGLAELPTSWLLQPSIIVRRDATHWHAYWLLVEGEALERFKLAQKQLALHFHSDPAVNDLPRVMRVPGFLHQKKEPVPVDLLHAEPGLKYTIDQVLAVYGCGLPNEKPDKFLKTEHSLEEFRDWALKKPIAEGTRHHNASNIAIEGCARRLDRAAVQEIVAAYLTKAGKDNPQEAKDLIAWAYDKQGQWQTQAAEEKLFDMTGYLEMITESAHADKLEAVRQVYNSADQWGHLACDEFAIFKQEIKELLGDGIDKNQLGTIRKEFQKKDQARQRQDKIDSVVDKEMILDRQNPLATAETFILRQYRDEYSALSLLNRYAGEIWLHNGKSYDMKEREWLRDKVYSFLKDAKVTTSKGIALFKPDSAAVDKVIDALHSSTFIDAVLDMPFWKDGATAPNPGDIIAFKNGLLDIRQWINNPATPLIAHSPRWFSATCLPFDYNPAATCPTWLKCLDQWFTTPMDMDDMTGRNEFKRDTIECFAMFIGYLLTQDTSQQKIGLLIGPPRSGKGTTGRVLMSLLGQANVVNPTLNSLSKEFGLAPCIGKQLAFVGDAHLGKSVDPVTVLDILKSISGEDSMTINRKFKDALTMKLTTRFVIAGNQLEQFPDPSGALAARLLVFNFNQSFLGQENLHLDQDLEAELPGIANWALAGLARLRQTGRLVSPKASQQLVQEFRNLSSPVSAFIEECCHQHGSVERDAIFSVWRKWCLHEGREAGSHEKFGTKLRAALPGFQTKQESEGYKRRRIYSPISLNERGQELLNQFD